MSPADFEDYARLWQQEPTPSEREAFLIMAKRASRRARLIDLAEVGFAILLASSVLIAIFMQPRPATLAIGMLTVLAVAASSWKRHLLGRIRMTAAAQDPRSFIDAANEQIEAVLRRSTIGMWALLPGVLLGALLRHSYRHGGDLSRFGDALAGSMSDWPHGPAVLFAIAICLSLVVRDNLRLRRESARLRQLQSEYRREEELENGASDRPVSS